MTDHPYTLGDFSIGDRVAWQLADGTYRVGTLTELNVKPATAVRTNLPPKPSWWRFRALREWKRLRAATLTWGSTIPEVSLTVGESEPVGMIVDGLRSVEPTNPWVVMPKTED
ncbi:hypothetical protein ACLQ3K_25725 [Tsukamurella sp. DT100]|uniref:hypothetical protein n=1 Tax=Tsukamurella sp. DT100 TaxID=3393415 RepID=UPI003CE92994